MKHSIKIKIVAMISICIFAFSFVSNIVLSGLLGTIISNKTDEINRQYMNVISKQINDYLKELSSLGVICLCDETMNQALVLPDLTVPKSRSKALAAQERMNAYLSSSILSPYIMRFIIYNEESILIESTATRSSSTILKNTTVREKLTELPLHDSIAENNQAVFQISDSISDGSTTVLAYLCPVTKKPDSYIYIEVSLDMIQDQLEPYKEVSNLFVKDEANKIFIATPDTLAGLAETEADWGTRETMKENGKIYKINQFGLSQFGMTVYSLSEATLLAADNLYIIYLLCVILVTILCIGWIVAHFLSLRITKPIELLIRHIRTIEATNDFSYQPAIEQSQDEIGEIGKSVNHMVAHIHHLLKQQDEMYEQRRRIELELLRSQVNPHFLYNTLDSIHWMAVIQNSNNIAKTIKALENLLRNLAKGADDKISLKEELSLADDYVHIQSIRYVESFDYVNQVEERFYRYKIAKFVLQPIVENAILHGIEPTGRFGIITVSAREDGKDLYIDVEDNGAGMDEGELLTLRSSLTNTDKNSLSGIGVPNVDSRLKLIYGESYGLQYESKKDFFTRVTIKIPKEEITDV